MPCPNHPSVVAGLSACSRCRAEFCPNCLVTLRDATYCAACKAEVVKDVQAGIVTTGLDLASIGRRFGAQLIDGFLLNIVTRIVTIPLSLGLAASSGGALTGPFAVFGVTFLIACAMATTYEALMLTWRGQTLGKMAVKVKVVNASGGDITAGQAWIRSAVRTLTALLLLVDYIFAFFTKERTCLHDMAAETRVVRWG